MLIVSKYRDYYDKIGASFGVDKTIVFNRRSHLTEEVKFIKPSGWSNFNTKTKPKENETFRVNLLIVGFCGKTYVGIAHRVSTIVPAPYGQTTIHNDKFYWGRENITKYLDRPLSKNEIDYLNNVDGSKNYTDIFIALNAPIFTYIDSISDGRGELGFAHDFFKSIEDTKDERDKEMVRSIAVNNNLSQLNFQSVVYPVIAFQEIQMFISGVLGVGEKPMIEISNNDKIVSQGFDLKTSFRKDTPPTRKQKVK